MTCVCPAPQALISVWLASSDPTPSLSPMLLPAGEKGFLLEPTQHCGGHVRTNLPLCLARHANQQQNTRMAVMAQGRGHSRTGWTGRLRGPSRALGAIVWGFVFK